MLDRRRSEPPSTINLLRTCLSGRRSEMMFSNSCCGCIRFPPLLRSCCAGEAPRPHGAGERPDAAFLSTSSQNETRAFPVFSFNYVFPEPFFPPPHCCVILLLLSHVLIFQRFNKTSLTLLENFLLASDMCLKWL